MAGRGNRAVSHWAIQGCHFVITRLHKPACGSMGRGQNSCLGPHAVTDHSADIAALTAVLQHPYSLLNARNLRYGKLLMSLLAC